MGLELLCKDIDQCIVDWVDQMWVYGFVDEVCFLVNVGFCEGLMVSCVLGYCQVLEYLNGDYDEDEVCCRIIIGICCFVCKQFMWYCCDDCIEWFNVFVLDFDDWVVVRVLIVLMIDEED